MTRMRVSVKAAQKIVRANGTVATWYAPKPAATPKRSIWEY